VKEDGGGDPERQCGVHPDVVVAFEHGGKLGHAEADGRVDHDAQIPAFESEADQHEERHL
jgi:hypothetical protein